MDTQNNHTNYLEWKDAEESHAQCLNWISEISFIKDEHKFFEDILKEYTLPVLESNLLEKARALVLQLTQMEQQENILSQRLTAHRNDLKILVDDIDQIKEENRFRDEHLKLEEDILNFKERNRLLKKEMFETISSALKKSKKNRFLR